MMAWIYDCSKTYIINSNQIQSATCKFYPDFEIAVIMSSGTASPEQGTDGGLHTYTIYQKKIPLIDNPEHRKKIQKRIDELQTQVRQLSALLRTRGEGYPEKDRLKITSKLGHLKKELATLEDPRLTDEKQIIEQRKADPEIRKAFQKFLDRISEPGFHSSNEIIDFSEII